MLKVCGHFSLFDAKVEICGFVDIICGHRTMFELKFDGRIETAMKEAHCMHSSSVTWLRHLSGNGCR